MITIRNIDEQVTYFNDDISEEVKQTLPTYRSLFKAALGMYAAKNASEAIDIYAMGQKVKNSPHELILEDAEFELLKRCCLANPAHWMAHWFAEVTLKLQEAEKA